MYYKLIKENKVISISQVPISLKDCTCQEISKEEYDLIKQNFEELKEKETEIEELKSWFFDYYTIHEQKFRRLIFLNTLDDDGGDPSQKLFDLYAEAEAKRQQIHSLESQI